MTAVREVPMFALLPLLLLVAQSNLTIAVSQLNRPTIDPSSDLARVVFAVDVTNTGAAPVRLTNLTFETAPSNRHRYAIDRLIAPAATTRIPVMREMMFGTTAKAIVTVDVTFATAAGERVESRVVPVGLRVD